MGVLVPNTTDIRLIDNKDEREVVRKLIAQLSDKWLILPTVRFRSDNVDREIDILLINPEIGMLDLEVKGHEFTIKDGLWHANGGPVSPQPQEQAIRNSHELLKNLKSNLRLPHISLPWAIIAPRSVKQTSQLPSSMSPWQFMSRDDLDNLDGCIEHAIVGGDHGRTLLAPAEVELIVNYLCPTIEFGWDEATWSRMARDRLNMASDQQIQLLSGLDNHRRVFVAGGAGTGKTRLAQSWAMNALNREERVLLTCYNDPLGEWLSTQFSPEDNLVVAPVLRFFQSLLPNEPQEGLGSDGPSFWTEQLIGEVIKQFAKIEDRFDTIIIDEAQDFSPAWIALLEGLLADPTHSKLLVLGDTRQDLMDRGFRAPEPLAGWTVAELPTNVRNSHAIARLLRNFPGGAAAPSSLPESTGITTAVAENIDACIKELTTFLVQRNFPSLHHSDVLIITDESTTRDRIRALPHISDWDHQQDDHIVCETAYRAKGLEADCVIWVSALSEQRRALQYVGFSRAVNELHVISPRVALEKLHLPITH